MMMEFRGARLINGQSLPSYGKTSSCSVQYVDIFPIIILYSITVYSIIYCYIVKRCNCVVREFIMVLIRSLFSY